VAKGVTAQCGDALQIEHVSRRLDLRDTKSSFEHQSLIIEVAPAATPGCYRASLSGETLCASRTPFLAAARQLIERSHAPHSLLVMRWRDSPVDALRARLGAAARLTVVETERAGPVFRPYTPPPKWPARCRGSAQDGDFEAQRIPLPGAGRSLEDDGL
jgi:hypothetical protein